MSDIKRLIYQAHSITGELIPPPILSKKLEAYLPPQNLENLKAIVPDISGEQGVYAQPVQFSNQQAMLFIEPITKLTEENMVQAVCDLLDSFNISFVEKLNIITVTQEKICDNECVDMVVVAENIGNGATAK